MDRVKRAEASHTQNQRVGREHREVRVKFLVNVRNGWILISINRMNIRRGNAARRPWPRCCLRTAEHRASAKKPLGEEIRDRLREQTY